MTVDPEAREALLPCPFCGGRAFHDWPSIQCGTCGAEITCWGNCTDDRRIAKWNRRVVPPNAVVVPTEGEEWEAMVERAIEAAAKWYGDWHKPSRGTMRAALRAAITPKQETNND